MVMDVVMADDPTCKVTTVTKAITASAPEVCCPSVPTVPPEAPASAADAEAVDGTGSCWSSSPAASPDGAAGDNVTGTATVLDPSVKVKVVTGASATSTEAVEVDFDP